MAVSTIQRLRVLAELAGLTRSQWWPQHRIQAWQRRMLLRQLRYAVTHIPWYRDLGIDAAEITGPEALDRFPRLTKSIIQREEERLRNPSMDPARLYRSVTSGSSGQPTTTWFDARSWLLCKYAIKMRRMLEAGAPWRQRVLIFDETANRDGSVPQVQRTRLLSYRQTRLSVFTPLSEQFEELVDLKPTAIYGSPSGIKELGDYARQAGRPLPPVPTLFLASELISDGVRRQIRSQFNARVIGIYGSTEFKEIAHECSRGKYHLNFESAYVEVVSDADEPPRLLLTSLVNRAMPLIRFDIGDYATLERGDCGCGRQSPYLANIVGREAEFLHLPDGRRLSPYRLTTAIETTPGLIQYQFVQHRDLALELRVVFARSRDRLDASLETLRERLQAVLGSHVDVPISPVDSIERTARGKHQVVTRLA